MAFPFPTPNFVTGGCLCNRIRYRIDFPADHNFETSSGTCQCTQCRKQTGSLFFASHRVAPASTAFRLTTSPGAAGGTSLKTYRASPCAERAFCAECGSFLYWRRSRRRRRPSSDHDPAPGNHDDDDNDTDEEAAGHGEKKDDDRPDYVCVAVGSIDPLYLFGEGADGVEVPREGFGRALAGGGGEHSWCANEVKGVTDEMEFLGKRRGWRVMEG